MKTPEEEVRHLLAPLAKRPPLTPERQAAIWQRIEAERARRSWSWLWLLAGAAAAAGAFLLLRPSMDLPQQPPETAQETARVLPSGARIEVDGQLDVVEGTPDDTRLHLQAGRVISRVPKLQAGQRYRVETPTAAVEVRGTVFEVALEAGGTRVTVQEGRVEVQPRDGRPARLLSSGEQWTVWPNQAAAEAAGDTAQALEITALSTWELPPGLERHNTLLKLGHTLDRHNPAAAPAFWGRLAAEAGPHAEEAAFRHAAALRALGRSDEARAAAARFRERFPTSPRAAETARW